MAKRRANREGSVYKRADGVWCASVSLEHGRRRTFYGRTRAEAADKLIEGLKRAKDGLPMPTERQTVSAYLEGWLAATKPSLKPATWRRYEQYVRVHAAPYIGRLPLTKLGPQHLERLYADRPEAGLSAMSCRHLHAVLHRALSVAYRQGLIARNVSDLVDPPRAERHEMETLSLSEARAFLDAAAGDRLQALYLLALTTGARQGELLALTWRDVDFERGTIQVRGSLDQKTREIQSPKTAGSRRQIVLTPSCLEALRCHRVAQAEERLRSIWWGDGDLVFTSDCGTPISATNLLRRSFKPLLKKAGIQRSVRFHDLRHTAATLLLGQGMHPRLVADLLGHSRTSVTLDTYSHVSSPLRAQVAEAMEAALG